MLSVGCAADDAQLRGERVLPAATRGDLFAYDTYYVLDHFLGRKLVNSVAGAARRRARDRFLERLRKHTGVVRPIPRRRDLEPAVFVREHLATGVPVIFEGAAQGWPCTRDWTHDFFRTHYAGERAVVLPSHRTRPGFQGTREPEAVTVTTYGDVIGAMADGPDAGYIRFGTIIEDCPELIEAIDLDWITSRFGALPFGHRIYLFLGARGSRTRLHCDFPPNLFVQAEGRKHWKLYDPRYRVAIDPLLERSSLSFTCNVECREPWMTDDSVAPHLDSYEGTLEPGDVLFNPAYMWHDVDNLSDSIGISVRWLSPAIHRRASWVMQLLNLFATNPPLWRAGLTSRDVNEDLLSTKNKAKRSDDYVG